jgi:hypothetical protein
MISLKRRSEKDLRAVNRRQMELMRMLLLLQRARRKVLEGRQIHEAIGIAQEGLHSIKIKKQKSMVVKVDLSKAYDRVSLLYLKLILIHLGFSHQFVVWVMNCITSTSFVVMINGETSPFFKPGRGLRQGCPLSPLLFLLIVEGLSRLLKEASKMVVLKGL